MSRAATRLGGGQALELVRAAYGLCQLLAPELVAGRVLHVHLHRRTALVVRVLGARHVAQAVLTLTAGRRGHQVGAVVDLLHAASLVPLGAWSGERRLAAADGAVAVGLAVAETGAARG